MIVIFIVDSEQKHARQLACDSIRKNHSLNSCMFHEGMSRELALQQHILDNLDSAVNNNHIRVLYQPIVKISSGKICEIEALARWLDPERGFISPGEFINTLVSSLLGSSIPPLKKNVT